MSTNKTILGTAMCALALLMTVSGARTDAQGPVSTLTLQVHQVKAIKECRGSFGSLGADEIDLGAVVIDSKGGVRRRTMDLGQFGHDGSTKNFTPPRQFIGFRVSGGGFPKVNQVLLVLAERDAGSGFGKYLDKLVAETKSKVEAAQHAERPTQGPRLVLASALQAEAVAGELAKEAAKILGKKLLETAIDAREDDIFPASMQSMEVTGPAFRFSNGQLTSPKVVVPFKKGSCDYSLTYSWNLS
jgi:hypothetical protein